jgi:Zn-dependent protease with chaperone function
MTNETVKINPTQKIDVSFSAYVGTRKALVGAHMVGGIPDYAYGVDHMLMQKMKAMPGVYKLFKALTNQWVPRFKQICNLDCLKVGPSQHPHIYEQVKECARTLGIGIPEVFIRSDAGVINAETVASEDDAPVMVLTSGLVERFTPGEIKTVIGHECGHIHNNHTIYRTAANIILDNMLINIPIPVIKELGTIVSGLANRALHAALSSWSRAAEVTADRAGLICADDFNDAITAECKLLYGATFTQEDINVDAILKQYDRLRSTSVRMLELETSHPSSVRRILAMKEFMNSDALYKWRPELKIAGMELIGKQELDARCEKYISVLKSEKRRK